MEGREGKRRGEMEGWQGRGTWGEGGGELDHAPFIHHRHIQIEMNRECGESYLFIAPVNIVVFRLIDLTHSQP